MVVKILFIISLYKTEENINIILILVIIKHDKKETLVEGATKNKVKIFEKL